MVTNSTAGMIIALLMDKYHNNDWRPSFALETVDTAWIEIFGLDLKQSYDIST